MSNKRKFLFIVFGLFISLGIFAFSPEPAFAYDAVCVTADAYVFDYCCDGCFNIDCNVCAQKYGVGLCQSGNQCCLYENNVCTSNCANARDYGCGTYSATPALRTSCNICDRVCSQRDCPSPYVYENGYCFLPKEWGTNCGANKVCGNNNGVCDIPLLVLSFSPENITVGQSSTWTITGYKNARVKLYQKKDDIYIIPPENPRIIQLDANGRYSETYTSQPGQGGTYTTYIYYETYPAIKNDSRLIVRERVLPASLEIVNFRSYYTIPFDLTLKVRGTPNSDILFNAVSITTTTRRIILQDHRNQECLKTGLAGPDGYGEAVCTFRFGDVSYVGDWDVWVNVAGQMSNIVSLKVVASSLFRPPGEGQNVFLRVSPSTLKVGESVNISVSTRQEQKFNKIKVWLSSDITGSIFNGAPLVFTTPSNFLEIILLYAITDPNTIRIQMGELSFNTRTFYESAIFEMRVEAIDTTTDWPREINLGLSNAAFFEVQPLGAINFSASYNSYSQRVNYTVTSNYPDREVFLWRWKNNQPEIQSESLGKTNSQGNLSVGRAQTCERNAIYQAYVVISGIGNSNSVTYNTPCPDQQIPPPGESLDLWASLSANPSLGEKPLNTQLTTQVFGTAQGTVNYTYWWNCHNASANVWAVIEACGNPDGVIGNQNGAKFDNINNTTHNVSHIYQSAGNYTAKVIVERGTYSAEARTQIRVSDRLIVVPPPPPPNGPPINGPPGPPGNGSLLSCDFYANPQSINIGQSSTLYWDCQNANSCSIDQGISEVNPISGQTSVRPGKTTTYTLTCQGPGGPKSWQTTVNVGLFYKIREIIPR